MQATQSIWRAWGARAAVLAMAGLLVACASKHPPAEPVLQGPVPGAAQMGPPEPAAPGVPPSAAAQVQAQKEAQAAVEELEDGHEDEARALLRKAVNLDPNNKLAVSLLRQLNLDPVSLFGRESFSYTVKPGESLSRIAGHFMGDIYLFYGLARYNDIKVPKQVAGGQVIRVPGRAPAEEREPARSTVKPAPKSSRQAPTPVAPPAAVMPATPAVPVAPAVAASVPAVVPVPPAAEPAPAPAVDTAAAAKAKAEAQRQKLIEQHTQKARASLARQDLDGAIANWSKVLELDPGNDTARLERQKAIALKEKVKALK
ncbi:MAG: LysM peptidoglycan-binding domain-containing protein [Aquabacterium sp.]|uniref:LysM peptidoglycan-binding domain-containing protein n=1 Tax=Aquabacterium sp. TaxID=1872578 RepID=UPI0025BAE380|nr:LysM domain-containing protein [Aquabacterium sp.]MBI3382086.1 LysM peptidoglycan-binding domain-containing protein [Aquabacterium sp.]